MIKINFVLMSIFAIGCTQLQASRLHSACAIAEEASRAVCNVVSLLSDGSGVINQTCDRVAKTMSADEWEIAMRAVECSEKYTEKDRAVCIAGIDGWNDVIEKLRK